MLPTRLNHLESAWCLARFLFDIAGVFLTARIENGKEARDARRGRREGSEVVNGMDPAVEKIEADQRTYTTRPRVDGFQIRATRFVGNII